MEPIAFVDGAQSIGSEIAAAVGKVGGRLESTTANYDAPRAPGGVQQHACVPARIAARRRAANPSVESERLGAPS
jgi:hypothetical protein